MNPSRYLSSRDLKDVLLISRTALECSQVNELRKEVLRLLEEVFKADSSNFFLCTGPDQKTNFDQVVNRAIEDKFLSQFREYYYKLDPFCRHAFPLQTSVITTKQIIPLKNWIDSEYYNDFLRLQSIHHEMVIYLKSGNQKLGVIALFRPRKAADFSAEETTKAELMAPYLTGALGKTVVSEQFIESEGIIKSITSNLTNKGIIILDENLEPMYQNEEAVKLLSALSQADINGEKSRRDLPRKLYLCCQEFKKSILPGSASKSSTTGHQQFITVGEEQILIRLHPLPCGERSTLVLICMEPDKPSFDQKQNTFGLTRREMEVISFLSLGLKNTEIAAKLFISEHTVENHLKSIYQKLDVRNRTSLIHRLTHSNCPTSGGSNGSNGF